MVAPKFNKKLAQLEAIHQVGYKDIAPIYLSDYIHYILENNEKYDTKEIIHENNEIFINRLSNILKEEGHLISKKSILEGIKIFRKEENEAPTNL